MASPIAQSTVAGTHARLDAHMRAMASRLPGWISQYEAPVSVSAITGELIPALRDYATVIRDRSGFPQAWIAALSAYASTQVLEPPADWIAWYDGVRSALVDAISAAVGALPVDADGYVQERRYEMDGTETIRVIDAPATLLAALRALRVALMQQ